MTETPFRKFHSPLQRFMKAPLRMERLPHFRVPLPANEQVGAHTPEEYVLLSEHVIFLYSTSILGGQQMVPPPAETKALQTLYSMYDGDKIGAKAPNLEKLLARRSGQLRSIVRTAVYYISSSAPVNKKKRKEQPRCKLGRYLEGYVSTRYLAKQEGRTHNWWCRALNMCCWAGLLRKEWTVLWNQGQPERGANLYAIIPPDETNLPGMEERAKLMLERKVTIGGITKAAAIALFGQETADEIYRDNRAEGEEQRIFNEWAEEIVREQIARRGYITKPELLDKLRNKADTLLLFAGRHSFSASESALEWRFNAAKPCLLEEYDYRRVTKKDAARTSSLTPVVGRFAFMPKQDQ